MLDSLEEVVWHNDGHVMYLHLNRSEVTISQVVCPQTEDRQCKVGKFDCIVTYFLETYGLDCNVGICECSGNLELAWSVVGDTDDPELCQVWVIPVDDEAFSAWLITQS